MIKSSQNRLDKVYKITLLSILSAGLLYYGGSILLPILFSFFAALGLANFAQNLEKKGLPKFLSALIPTLLFSIVFFGVFFFVVYEGYFLVNELTTQSSVTPKEAIDQSIDVINDQVTQITGTSEANAGGFWEKIISSSNAMISSIFETTTTTLSFFALVPVYIFFMLSSRHLLVKFIYARFEEQEKKDNFLVLSELSTVVKNYLKGISLVVLIITILNCIGLYVLGIKYALALGILSGVLTIIPYIGVFLGAIIPLTVAYITGESQFVIFSLIGIYVLIQFIEGNFITPKIMGKTLDLNPLAIILGAVLMGACGGILAIVLTVPVLAAIKVFLKHSENNKSYALLLSEG